MPHHPSALSRKLSTDLDGSEARPRQSSPPSGGPQVYMPKADGQKQYRTPKEVRLLPRKPWEVVRMHDFP